MQSAEGEVNESLKVTLGDAWAVVYTGKRDQSALANASANFQSALKSFRGGEPAPLQAAVFGLLPEMPSTQSTLMVFHVAFARHSQVARPPDPASSRNMQESLRPIQQMLRRRFATVIWIFRVFLFLAN